MDVNRNRLKTQRNAMHIKHPIPILFENILFGRYKCVKENLNRNENINLNHSVCFNEH